MTAPLPTGFRVVLDPLTRQLDERTWFGGSPVRVMRLTPAGCSAWDELQGGSVASARSGALARRLTDAGLAHPRPSQPAEPLDVTVVIPVRDRPVQLDRCLRALGAAYPVVVVDDGSADPGPVAVVAARHRAVLVRRDVNGGPGAARNSGLAAVRSDLVAFVDSDCVPDPAIVARLAAQFADPLVAAVAPRVVPLHSDTFIGRYTAANGSLDLGGSEARVVPRGRVSYVPTATLVARRAALLDAAVDDAVFDPALRYGEDVDLVWRLHRAGRRVRYDPSVQVRHDEPSTWRALLARRYRYGTSAGPLAARHGSAVAPLVLRPWPTLTVLALLARRPGVAAIGVAGALVTTGRSLRRADVPTAGLLRAVGSAVLQTWLGLGRYGTQLGAPLLVAGVVRSHGWRRLAFASLLAAPALTSWWTRRPRLGPVRFAAAQVAEDVAYGAGVWTGSARARTTAAVRPAVVWHAVPIDAPRTRTAQSEKTRGSR